MYHTADIKRWIHHVHMPSHESIEHAEKLCFNKQVWSIIAILALAAFFILLVIWAAHMSNNGYSLPTFYPYGPVTP